MMTPVSPTPGISPSRSATNQAFEQARFNMVEQQIRTWDVLDQDVLDLLFVIRREDYVPTAYRELAFADLEIGKEAEEGASPVGATPGRGVIEPAVTGLREPLR